jgi:hypothetical protein
MRPTQRAKMIKKQEASAERLLVKMATTGKDPKRLLRDGLTSKRQLAALRSCENRDSASRHKEGEGQ